MRIFCDTSVLVAAFVTGHPHYARALPLIERVKAGSDDGFIAAHSLAETYAVLTRLPAANRVPSGIAWQLISENLLKGFSVVALTQKEYGTTLERAASEGIEGGRIYDALLIAAAAKASVERIYTFNVGHFQDLAEDALRERIVAP